VGDRHLEFHEGWDNVLTTTACVIAVARAPDP